MWGSYVYHSRRSKAQATTFVIAMVVLLIIVGMVIARGVIVARGAKIRDVIDVYIELEDDGRKLSNFLSSSTPDLSRMEIAGSMLAEGSIHIDAGRKKASDVLDEMDSYIVVYDSEGRERGTLGDVPGSREEEIRAEIPVPGAGKAAGGARGEVRFG